MSDVKHTPGPWEIYCPGNMTEVQHPGESPPIVSWTGFDDADRDLPEHRANARLIAAAPDLLAVCKRMWPILADAILRGLPVTKEVAAARKAMMDATNKAEGTNVR